MSFDLAVRIREYMKAALSPPRSEPAKGYEFLPSAMILCTADFRRLKMPRPAGMTASVKRHRRDAPLGGDPDRDEIGLPRHSHFGSNLL